MSELDDYECLLEAQDRDIFSWLTGEAEPPSAYDTPVLRKIRAFHSHAGPIHMSDSGGRLAAASRKAFELTLLVTDLKRVVAELAKGGSLTLSSVADGFDAFCAADLTRALARHAESRAVVLVHVARDGQRARAFGEALAFAAPDIELLDFPVLGLPAL